MYQNIIAKLLAGTWEDPDTGERLSVPIHSIEIRNNITNDCDALITQLDLGKHIAVVSDPDTHDVLGAKIEKALEGRHKVISIILPIRPDASETHVSNVREQAAKADAYIAVGSGTINDICKYASFLDGKPYAVFGTAPSMNGYSSANAAITVRGNKKSLQAQLPVGIFLDLDILSAAPGRLIRSGLGDSLCRTTAQADWLLAHLLFDTPYMTAPFSLLKPYEEPLFDQAAALMQGDAEAMEFLAKTLVLSGIGMYLASGSYPASQGEHMVAHTMEMVNKSKHSLFGGTVSWPLHGEQIGVTTLTLSRLQHRILQKRPVFRADTINEKAIVEYFGKETGAACIEETRRKMITQADAERLNETLDMYWLTARARLFEVMLPTERLEEVLKAANAPLDPEGLGWSRPHYNLALQFAPFTRDRFTFLDLARVTR